MQSFKTVTALAFCALVVPGIFLHNGLSALALNTSELSFARTDLYTLAAVVLLAWMVVLIYLITAHVKVQRFSLAVLASFAVNVLIWNAIFPHLWLHTIWHLVVVAGLELGAFFGLVWLFAKLNVSLLIRAVSLFAVLNIGTTVWQYWHVVDKLPPDHRRETVQSVKPNIRIPEGRKSPTGNVYHVVLDAFPRDFLSYAMARGKAPNLSGFTFYKNSTSNYGRTYLSMRSVFRGETWPIDFTEWSAAAFEEGFTGKLAASQIPQHFFPFYRYYCSSQALDCSPTAELYQFFQDNSSANFLVDSAFLQILPVSVRNVAMGSLGSPLRPVGTWDYGYSVSGSVESLIAGYPVSKRPIQSITLNTFEQFQEREPFLSSKGRYTFVHVMVPHEPLVFDRACTFVDPSKQSRRPIRQQLEEQNLCALSIVEKLTSQLRALARYDNSLIIIHSDHGISNCHMWNPNMPFNPAIANFERKDGGNDILPAQQVNCLASALLLVKAPNQQLFEISSEPVQLIDIAPTVLDFFNIDRSEFQGVSLLSKHSDLSEREVAYFETNTQWIGKLTHFSKFIRDGETWKYTGRVDLAPDASNSATASN